VPNDDKADLWIKAKWVESVPIFEEKDGVISGFQTGQVNVDNTAMLVATIGSAPENDGVLVSGSAAAFIAARA
jgi:hypothetical protein